MFTKYVSNAKTVSLYMNFDEHVNKFEIKAS